MWIFKLLNFNDFFDCFLYFLSFLFFNKGIITNNKVGFYRAVGIKKSLLMGGCDVHKEASIRFLMRQKVEAL
jgi:hypothetical protein